MYSFADKINETGKIGKRKAEKARSMGLESAQYSQYSQYSHLPEKAIPDTIIVIFAKDF